MLLFSVLEGMRGRIIAGIFDGCRETNTVINAMENGKEEDGKMEEEEGKGKIKGRT